jgi:hypothetical protein
MTLPALEGPIGLLPPGRHTTTLDEIEQQFVAEAPFAAERALVFAAFRVWVAQMAAMLPGTRYWVNGGFVTHKPWAAPSDIDVVILVRAADVNALPSHHQDLFSASFTAADAGGRRVQPMGGLVDAYFGLRDEPDRATYWHEFWGKVKLEDGTESATDRKGYVEVIV